MTTQPDPPEQLTRQLTPAELLALPFETKDPYWDLEQISDDSPHTIFANWNGKRVWSTEANQLIWFFLDGNQRITDSDWEEFYPHISVLK